MGDGIRFLIVVIAVAISGGVRAEDSGVNNRTFTSAFPPCNGSGSCTSSNFCTPINILEEFSSTVALSRAQQDTTNVICLDSAQRPAPTYKLLGCPREHYFETSQSTKGVCYVDTQNMWNLLLTPSTMVTGLHSFICFLGSNRSLIYSYAIVLNDQGDDTVLFTDVRVYRYVNDSDPIILTTANETVNVTVTAGHQLTIVARVVTTISGIIKAIASSPLHGENATDRFTTPDTGILCNDDDNDTRINNKFSRSGRYQLFGLPATMDDDQTMMRILINFTSTNEIVTIGRINITVHENPLPPGSTTVTLMPTELPSETEDDGSATIIWAVVISLLLVVILVVTIVIVIVGLIWRRWHKGRMVKSKIESTDSKLPAPVGDGHNTNQLRVLIYTCDDHPIGLLLCKLQQNDKFMIEELTKTTHLFQFNECISKVSIELTLGAILVDCSCSGQTHDDLHKAIRYFTSKPFGSNESKSWKVLRLIHTDVEIDSQSWLTSSFDHVEEMHYGELNDEVVDALKNKLLEYVPTSRASSIGSRKASDQLLEAAEAQRQGMKTEELAKKIITEVNAASNRVIGHIDKNAQETHNKLDDYGDQVGLVQTQVFSLMEDNIRREKEEDLTEQHDEVN